MIYHNDSDVRSGGNRVARKAPCEKRLPRGGFNRPLINKGACGSPDVNMATMRNRSPCRSEIIMKTIGYEQPLYILPFDHRGSFETKMFGWHGDLTASQTEEIAAAKQVIYDGFKAAVAAGVPKAKAGILVDEQFGAAILRDAKANGFSFACPAEKSGQEEFDFQYGTDFAKHIESFQPTFCKVLVRYNPEGDAAETNNRLHD